MADSRMRYFAITPGVNLAGDLLVFPQMRPERSCAPNLDKLSGRLLSPPSLAFQELLLQGLVLSWRLPWAWTLSRWPR